MEGARETLSRIRLQGHSALELLARPDFRYEDHPELPPLPPRALQQLTIDIRYAGYLAQQREQAKGMEELEAWPIPGDFDFQLPGISSEARQKLERRRPENLGQAARIDGVTPAEIAILQVHLRKGKERKP